MSDERAIIGWLVGRDTGSSSKCIVAHLYGREHDGSHPHDPDDLGRCLRLLKLFPALRARLGEMAAVSEQWAALVEHWDELATAMEDEVGIAWQKGRKASRTYALMRQILYPIESCRKRLTEGRRQHASRQQ